MTLLEKEILKRKNLKQFKGAKFGRIISAEQSEELEVRDRLKLSKGEFQEYKKRKEMYEQEKLQKRLDREAKEKAKEILLKREAEKREKKFKRDMATMEWRRERAAGNLPRIGEFNSFKVLAMVWKESKGN
jgi:hypothetical protein